MSSGEDLWKKSGNLCADPADIDLAGIFDRTSVRTAAKLQ